MNNIFTKFFNCKIVVILFFIVINEFFSNVVLFYKIDWKILPIYDLGFKFYTSIY